MVTPITMRAEVNDSLPAATRQRRKGAKTGAESLFSLQNASLAGRGRQRGGAARSAKLRQAFVASTESGGPMAQQLAVTRTAAAFTGVSAYAHSHQGEACCAYLAIGYAYLLDNRFAEAGDQSAGARAAGRCVGRLCRFPGRCKANHDGGNNAAAEGTP